MRIVEVDLREGIARLAIEDFEDLYYLSLFLDRGDLLYAWTTRQLKVERAGGRVERGARTRIYVGIAVEKVEFQRFSKRLRVLGRVVEAPEELHAKGRYHAVSLAPPAEVKIVKREISRAYLEMLREAERRSFKCLLASVGDSEAVLGILKRSGFEVLAEIESDRPREGDSLKREYEEYLARVVSALSRLERREESARVLVAAPRLLLDWLRESVSKERRLAGRVVYAEVSEGGMAGIWELVRSGRLSRLIGDLRIDYERELVERVLAELGRQRAAVGLAEASRAARARAVERLLITDSKLLELKESGELPELLEDVERSGGRVVVISGDYEHGKKLEALGGIAALLRFPLPSGDL